MKKFMIIAVALVLCMLGLYFGVYYGGLYVDLKPDEPIGTMVKTEGKTILLQNGNGEFKPFTVRGVNLASSLPGHFSTDYAVEEETWLRWFSEIREMGANTIRIYTIYDDTFYNAFYRFNTEHATPLYLLQGLQVSDYANNSESDAYGKDFYAALKQDSIDAVDVLHGRKNILLNRMKGSGNYRRDVSPWVLGYVLGNEWNAGTIAYTNHNPKHTSSYQGTYFCTADDSTVFEAMLARILDGLVDYESRKYKTQKLLSGYFAAYRLYDYCPDFSQYLSKSQKFQLRQVLSQLDTSRYAQGYTQVLSAYHAMPVVVTGYGFSSSRGTDTADGPLTEREQGERLMEAYADMIKSGCSGACIDTWQDVWERRTWNTSYAVDVNNAPQWHDIQTDGQGYGLLAFDPGVKQSVCYVDGNQAEWTPDDQVFRQNGLTLSARYDERCLYLLIQQEGMKEGTPFYLPIDVTPKSGSKISESPAVSFEREADFLLRLSGRTDSRLLVQARYEALRENYQMETAYENPFVSFPAKDAPRFVPVRMVLQNHKLVPEGASEEALLAAKLWDTFETGRLVYGNGNPTSADYNSLSDFCYGNGCVEVRLPWQLLNFSNPSKMEVHDDYYEQYGVERLPIGKLYLGVGVPGLKGSVAMRPVVLKGWREKVTFHERLKQSYGVVRESWGKRDAS